jgi:hypothetical protein
LASVSLGVSCLAISYQRSGAVGSSSTIPANLWDTEGRLVIPVSLNFEVLNSNSNLGNGT